jgi:N-acyl-D-amino-acid deacylase
LGEPLSWKWRRFRSHRIGYCESGSQKYNGQTLAQIAKTQGKDPLAALMDLVLADRAQTGALYFITSENGLRYGLQQPWTSVGLDGGETSLDGPLFDPHTQPRDYGSMPRFLGHYVRDQHLLPLEQAVRKITFLPAQRERLRDRGLLKEGFFADITIFDSATIIDKATYENPAQIFEGVKYVFANGKVEYEDGKLTGLNVGTILRGPGWTHPEQILRTQEKNFWVQVACRSRGRFRIVADRDQSIG